MDLEEQKNPFSSISAKEYEKLFKETYPGLCRFANKYVNDWESAEEIVQDVFVKLWEKHEQLEVRGSIKPYLMSSVKNTALNFIKHRNIVAAYEKEASANQVQADEEMADMELETAIYKAMEQLPEQRKKIFNMSRADGLKYHEIATKLGLSVKTVEAQMGKALKQLRESLKEYISVIIIAFTMFVGRFL